MTVIVSGGRDYTDGVYVAMALKELGATQVVAGGARGADTLAREAAEAMGLPFVEIKADWRTFGPSAGPRRNQEMLNFYPDAVVAAFPLRGSKGTLDMMRRAMAQGRDVIVYRQK